MNTEQEAARRKLFSEKPLTLGETKGWNHLYAELEFALAEKTEANEKFIKQFKKAAGTKKQEVLPSVTTAHNEWAVRESWSICDAMHWRSLCERVKYARDDIEGESLLELMIETIEVAAHCNSHPIGLIAFARTNFGAKTWDIDTVHMLKDNLLGDDEIPEGSEVDADDDEHSGSGKRRKRDYEASQVIVD